LSVAHQTLVKYFSHFCGLLCLKDDLKAIESRVEPIKRLFGSKDKDKEEESKLLTKDLKHLLELANRGVGSEFYVSAEKEKMAKIRR